MSNNLPVTQDENFVGEFHNMDLSPLKDKVFIVSVATGDRNKCKFLASTVHGPYSFFDMVSEVGNMWNNFQHHARVTILETDSTKAPKFLDEGTIDYIEAKYIDIVTDGMLSGHFDAAGECTCVAGVIEADTSDDPRKLLEEKREDVTEQDRI